MWFITIYILVSCVITLLVLLLVVGSDNVRFSTIVKMLLLSPIIFVVGFIQKYVAHTFKKEDKKDE